MTKILQRFGLLNYRVFIPIAIIQIIVVLISRLFLSDNGFLVFGAISGLVAAGTYWDLTRKK